MTTRLLIARHGNTFTKEQTPTRVGARTDLPLVEEGRGLALGQYLRENNLIPDKVFAAPLKRTMQTAELAIQASYKNLSVESQDIFTEVDYGPDENKVETEVVARLGQKAIDDWNAKGIVPDGWQIDVLKIKQTWMDFAKKIENDYKDKTVLVVSSNGIIRFAPVITGDFKGFCLNHDIKVSTGGLCIFEKESQNEFFTCSAWNLKPTQLIKDKK